MKVSLPGSLKKFVDQQVSERGYGSNSEYVRDLILKDRDRQKLRSLLLDGKQSSPKAAAEHAYFKMLRDRIRE